MTIQPVPATTLVMPPLAEPVSLADAKAHLRIETAEHDQTIGDLIAVARDHLERSLSLSLISQTWRLYLDAWPADGLVRLNRGPAQDIVDLRVYDEEGGEIIGETTWWLDGASRPARLWMRLAPQPRRLLNGIEIDVRSGFGDTATDVPDSLRRAILIHVAAMFELSGAFGLADQPAVIPDGWERLVAPFRMARL